MSPRKIVEDVHPKFQNGFPKPEPVLDLSTVEVADIQISIDELLGKGLLAIDRIIKCVLKEISTGEPSRDAILNLKDCMVMLENLKEKEQELLNSMTDEELKEKVSGNSIR